MAIRQPKSKPRVGRGANDHLRQATDRPIYKRDPISGLTISRFRCSCHGYEFETRAMWSLHRQTYHKAIIKDFEEIVRTGNLGQPAWERLPGESPMQYARFKQYLTSQNPKTGTRSMDRVAKIVGRVERVIRQYAHKWHWVLRAELWDRNIEHEEMEAFEREKRASAQRQARLGQKLQEVARAGAVALLADDGRVGEMTGNEIAKLADVGTKIERLANQDPTAISEDRGQVRLVWEGPKPDWAPEPDVKDRREEIGTRTHTRNVTLPAGPILDRSLTSKVEAGFGSGVRGVVSEAQDGSLRAAKDA